MPGWERHQVWAYLVAIAVGLAMGTWLPGFGGAFEVAVLPVVGVLIYATFTQVPLARLPEAARDVRFTAVLLGANFVVMPLVVWGIVAVVRPEPAVLVGIVLVLVVPCTDWFVTFTHLAGGDAARAVAATPVLLVVQLLMLPIYLWLFVGDDVSLLIGTASVVWAFVGLIVVPLLAAWLTQRLAMRVPRAERAVARLSMVPVPLLALVLFMIAASQVGAVSDQRGLLPLLAFVFAAYLLAALMVGWCGTRLFRLPSVAGRTLVFSLGTRNSFVVLPIALALPQGAEIAVVVVVFQSLVELLAMVVLLRIVPRVVRQPTSAGDV